MLQFPSECGSARSGVDLRFCSICMMCCLIMGRMILPPRPQAILSRALSPATALLSGGQRHRRRLVQPKTVAQLSKHLLLRDCEPTPPPPSPLPPHLSKSSSSSSSAMAHSSSSSRSTIMVSIWGTGGHGAEGQSSTTRVFFFSSP